MSKNKKQDNYMDYIPVKNPNYNWRENEKGRMIVEVVHKSIYDKIAQKLFKVPSKSDIELDEYGSFVLKHINGTNNIFDISKEVHNQFGEMAEPLLNRLVKFFQILKNNKFITYSKERISVNETHSD